MTPRQEQLKHFTNLLLNQEPFQLVKFNDGEWHAMVGKKGSNCDNHQYSQPLRVELIEAYRYLKDRAYISDWVVDYCSYPEHAKLAKLLGYPKSTFLFHALLHDLPHKGKPSLTKELHDFYAAIRNDQRPKVFVGPERLDPKEFLKIDHHIPVPQKDAFNFIGIPRTLCHDFANGYGTPIFLLCCGFSSCILAKEILQTNPQATILDLGSALDPALFGKTRTSQLDRRTIRNFYRDFNCNWSDMPHYYEEIDGWFNFEDVYSAAVESAHCMNQSLFVEVGTWLGKSAAYMGVEIINSGKPILFDCVDHFQGSTNERTKQHKLAKTRNIKGECANNLRPFWSTHENHDYTKRIGNPPNIVRIVPLTSHQAASTYDDNSIDFCFIDAGHTRKEVELDIKHWYPKVRPGGTLAGHDYSSRSFPGVKAAVDSLFPQRELVSKNCWKVVKPS